MKDKQIGLAMSEETPDQNFLSVVGMLNRMKLRYWLNEGTLLGVVRDGALIPWDSDIDIVVEADDTAFAKLRAELRLQGFSSSFAPLRRPGPPPLKLYRRGGRVVDLARYERRVIEGEPHLVRLWYRTDKFPPKEFWGKSALIALRFIYALYFLVTWSKLRNFSTARLISGSVARIHTRLSVLLGLSDTLGYRFPERFVGVPQEKRVFGVSCLVPSDSESVLEALYGRDWRTPINRSSWTQFFE